jgi:hypothetical protein
MTIEPAEAIELRVNEIAQLFETLDPFPFREGDLDKKVEEYIVSWAPELSVHKPIKIVIHLPGKDTHTKAAGELGEAITHYFAYRADLLQRELNELFRAGRRGRFNAPCPLFSEDPRRSCNISQRFEESSVMKCHEIRCRPQRWIILSALLLFTSARGDDPLQSLHFGTWGFDVSGENAAIKPGDDFFEFVNGGWLDRTPIKWACPLTC